MSVAGENVRFHAERFDFFKVLAHIFGGSAAGHVMMSGKYPDIRARQDRGFAIERGLLFMDLAQDILAQAGTASPTLAATHATMQMAMRRGFGASDIIVGRDKYLREE